MVLVFLIMAFLSTVVVWFGSTWLDKSSEKISKYLGLPQVVQGAIIAAVGSSAPELSSTVLSTVLHGEFVLGVSAIVGSAIFNILVIPGLSVLYAPGGGVKVSKDVVKGDGLFYTLAVAVTLIVFNMATVYFPTSDNLVGTMNRGLALIPVGLYGLYLFLQYQEIVDTRQSNQKGQEGNQDRTINIRHEIWVFLGSIVLIIVSVEGLVYSGLQIGELLKVPAFLWGLTIIAAATSLPDAKISVDAARRGEGDISIANVLGSNIFDLCFCIPAGILLAGTATIDLAQAAPMMGCLVLATVSLFVMLRTELVLRRGEGLVCLTLYTIFVAFVMGETSGVTSLLGGAAQSMTGS